MLSIVMQLVNYCLKYQINSWTGCPVCAADSSVDQTIWLASQANVILCSYADMLRVPGDHQDSLIKAKSRGADVRIIYSVGDALKLAQNNPDKTIVFSLLALKQLRHQQRMRY